MIILQESRRTLFILRIYVICFLFTTSVARGKFMPSLPTYEEVAKLGVSCYPYDTCMIDVPSNKSDPAKQRKCACDEDCVLYGDCCLDAKFVHKMVPEATKQWSCIEAKQIGLAYVKSSCSPTWNDEEIRRQCSNVQRAHESLNPLASLPVTSTKNNITYANYYCAICNGDTPDNLVFWKSYVDCEYLKAYNVSQKNLTTDYVAKHLEYSEEEESWGIWLYGGNHDKIFYFCAIIPVVPSNVEAKICPKELQSSCPKSWTDEDVRNKCHSYTSYISIGSKMYRNVHCALCNGADTSKASCQFVTDFQGRFGMNPFAILIDVNPGSGNIVGEVNTCFGKNELYDPYFRRCTNILCEPGYIYDNGKCKRDELLDTDKILVPKVYSGFDTIGEDGAPRSGIIIDGRNITDLNDTLSSYQFETCPKTTLQPNEYEKGAENGTIFVPKYNRSYNSSWYRMDPEQGVDVVVVCAHFVNNTDGQSSRKFSAYLGYISLFGMGISIVCLVMHFVVYVMVPDLHNLSGRNLTSLVVGLFCAYVCFLVGQMNLAYMPCKVVAIFTYYFFLASFFWMNAMAFDVWRTLRMATTELRVSNGRQWHRFVAYSIYSWVLSGLIVVASVVVDATATVDSDLRPSFGTYQCWFGHRKALLVFFATPAGIMMISNICLFVSSARMIIVTTKTSVSHQSSSARNNYKLYLRLSVIMGLTWVIGFVAGYSDVEVLWCIFVIFNTLQGLFIFIAFSCNHKVYNGLRDRFRSVRRLSSYRTSSINSASGSAYNTNSTVHTHLSRTITPAQSTSSTEQWKMSFH